MELIKKLIESNNKISYRLQLVIDGFQQTMDGLQRTIDILQQNLGHLRKTLGTVNKTCNLIKDKEKTLKRLVLLLESKK